MTTVKEKIIGAVTIMTESDAEHFWKLIVEKYSSSWDTIEEEEPDKIDLQMLKEMKSDPDCHVFTNEKDIKWD